MTYFVGWQREKPTVLLDKKLKSVKRMNGLSLLTRIKVLKEKIKREWAQRTEINPIFTFEPHGNSRVTHLPSLNIQKVENLPACLFGFFFRYYFKFPPLQPLFLTVTHTHTRIRNSISCLVSTSRRVSQTFGSTEMPVCLRSLPSRNSTQTLIE